ncbi:acetyl-CoA carboxylase biotin carboxylase subunit [Acetivibrio sp. MSJd-27]|uniref:acetyl-CoA carboxylase biotin carboxylase subunit n=1 Tax=Acetivibrio sp. MSJd-27 TaxID=2841523 RepID=UPI001C102A45|nr:acetyl-CoA carboxylase biotin carboxylase subunit [Acetivibrio sp. MSJd-27]MBU5449679.1 acetyl-CoA carboxylase biotin carboxylase subunit [Acetivibrio sp. MSJd-27]
MFQKVLIANRGEIAVRIIRALRELGIKSVAVYSKADEDALHVQLADEAICIGPPQSKDSYLNMQNILTACIASGCQAIHPGFGFLSENPNFVRMCELLKIKFIGPDASIIEMMGDKATAKTTMKNAGVPVVPGSDGEVDNLESAYEVAEEIGYPVMIKASAGGGGKGIRLVRAKEELENSFFSAKTEAKAAFGNDGMYIEKFIEEPKHIEIQILADEHGNIVHLGERDCSIQRRNQKIIEEAPAEFLGEEIRGKMGEAAKNAARAVGYKNAGTIEFLVDKYKNFYFMEMNTRVQVEHPITEMITGVDIVKEQVRIAQGEKLSFSQEDIILNGHSIECRICAENPKENFRPCPGEITGLHIPGGPGVRVDSAVYQGYRIPPYYDSMIAKIIVHADNRKEAIVKMRSALAEMIIADIETNEDYLLSILKDKDYVEGNFNVSFLTEKKF